MEAMEDQSECSNPVLEGARVATDAVSQSTLGCRGHEQKSLGCRFGKSSIEQSGSSSSQSARLLFKSDNPFICSPNKDSPWGMQLLFSLLIRLREFCKSVLALMAVNHPRPPGKTPFRNRTVGCGGKWATPVNGCCEVTPAVDKSATGLLLLFSH